MSGKAVSLVVSRRDVVAWVVVFAAAVAPVLAAAQEGRRRRPRLTPEDRDAALVLRAEHVAATLGLTKEVTGQLVFAHREARESFNRSMAATWRDGRSSEEARSSRSRATYAQLAAEERAKFEKAIAAFLTEEQAKKVADRLGAFSSQWDVMVHTVAGFELGEKQGDALEFINTYIIDRAKLWESADAQGEDRTALVDKVDGLKEKLDESLAPFLSEEQKGAWEVATSQRHGPRSGRARSDGRRVEGEQEGGRGDGGRRE
jgi:hypothetical protein